MFSTALCALKSTVLEHVPWGECWECPVSHFLEALPHSAWPAGLQHSSPRREVCLLPHVSYIWTLSSAWGGVQVLWAWLTTGVCNGWGWPCCQVIVPVNGNGGGCAWRTHFETRPCSQQWSLCHQTLIFPWLRFTKNALIPKTFNEPEE